MEISDACNRSCVYCPVADFPKKQTLISEEVLVAFLNSIVGFRGDVMFNAYNEPMLHPNLCGIIRRVKAVAPKARVIIYTNADKLTEESLNNVINAGADHFFVTRHPPYKDEWDERVFGLARKYPRRIKFNNITDWLNRTGLVDGRLPGANAMKGITSCRYPEGDVNIRRDGSVMFCCNDFHNVHTVDNILNRSIEEIYYSPEQRELRRKLRAGIFEYDVCKKCIEAE